MKPVIVAVSGGLDSVTLAYSLHDEGRQLPLILSVDYGQRHKKELLCAALCADRLGAAHEVIDISRAMRQLAPDAASALLYGGEVPDGHYASETMRVTVVPGRNMLIMALLAVAAQHYDADVGIAVHAGDHTIYSDCRPAFIDAARRAVEAASDGRCSVIAPFLHSHKADIAREAHRLGVPVADTWSCYKGGERQCGTCGTCVERKEAFSLAGVDDPTKYEA